MRIGIDIDDVLTNTSEKIKEYLYKYEKSGDGIKYIVEVMRGEIPTENIKIFLDRYINEICKNVTVKEDAENVIKELLKYGHEIIFITSRGEIRFQGTEKTTLEYLKAHNIKYTDIIFNSFEKQVDCKKNNIDIIIDDSVKNCELVREEGIKAILYTSDINKTINTDIERVESWMDIKNKMLNYNIKTKSENYDWFGKSRREF